MGDRPVYKVGNDEGWVSILFPSKHERVGDQDYIMDAPASNPVGISSVNKESYVDFNSGSITVEEIF